MANPDYTQNDQGGVFPFDVLPLPLKIFCLTVAESMNCNPEFVAGAVLCAMSLAVGNKAKIQIKKGWREGAVLFVVIIGEPGSRKSPAISKAMEPHMGLQKIYGTEELDENSIRKTLITTDATMESLAEKLSENPHGIILLMDEAAGLWKGFGQYKKGGNDMEKFLSLWSQAMIIVTRKKAPTIQVDSPFLPFLGGTQVDLLDTLAAMKGNGFVDRLLFIFPIPIPSKHSDTEISDEIMEGYVRLILNIYETKIDGEQLILSFSEDAQILWREWHIKYCEEMDDDHTPYYLKGSLSKLEAYTARFALILEFARCAENNVPVESVSVESLQGAIKLTNYFKSQVTKVFSAFTESGQDKKVLRALAWFKKQPNGTATIRKVYTYRVGDAKNLNEAYDLLSEMKSRGLGTLRETSDGTKTTYSFYLSPEFFKKSNGIN